MGTEGWQVLSPESSRQDNPRKKMEQNLPLVSLFSAHLPLRPSHCKCSVELSGPPSIPQIKIFREGEGNTYLQGPTVYQALCLLCVNSFNI